MASIHIRSSGAVFLAALALGCKSGTSAHPPPPAATPPTSVAAPSPSPAVVPVAPAPVAVAPVPNKAAAPPAARPATASPPAGLPAVGVVTKIEQGDLACYIDVKDDRRAGHHLYADFELCENPKRFLGKRTRLHYKAGSINDCESNEPCGKSKRVDLVHKMEPVP